MGEEHLFAKGLMIGRGDDFGGNSSEFGVATAVDGMEEKRDKSRAWGNDVDAELASEIVAECSGTHFRNGKAAGGNDEDSRGEVGRVAMNDEFRGTLDFSDVGIEENLNGNGAGFRFEEVGDVGGGAVAEELAEGFLVIGDTMLFDESDEICGGEAREGRFGKMRIGREEIFGRAIDVGEIAAASAGDEDFLAEAVGAFEDGDAAATLPCFDGAEKTGGTGTENDRVEFARR